MFECVISKPKKGKDAKEPLRLLTKLMNCSKNGARLGKSPRDILKEEKLKNAAIDSIIDEEETKLVRTSELDKSHIEQATKKCEEVIKPMIDPVLQWVKKFYENIRKKGMIKNFIDEAKENDVEERLKKWLQAIDHQQQSIADKFLPNIKDVGSDWWIWQIWRLSLAWGTELAWKSGMNTENMDISNDVYDVHYVACLSKADGLLTADGNLVQPLAKAAFPEKDIFCNIDEVPSEYICSR